MLSVQTPVLIVQTALLIIQTALLIELYYAILQRLSMPPQHFIYEIGDSIPDDVFSLSKNSPTSILPFTLHGGVERL